MIVPAQLPQENGVKQRRRVLPITFLTIEGGKKKTISTRTCPDLRSPYPFPFFYSIFTLSFIYTKRTYLTLSCSRLLPNHLMAIRLDSNITEVVGVV